jgi:clan AA aspartic protease (TIGR02281 family)
VQLSIVKEDNTLVLPNVRLTGSLHMIHTNLMLDTGASHCMLSWSKILELGYPRKAHRPIVSLATANGIIRAEVVILKEMVIDDITIRGIPLFCHDLPDLGIPGLIGLSALKKLCTTIDYRNLLLRIE